MAQQAFADDVFTWPADEPQLIGGRCAECAAVTFPEQPSCARCGATEVEQHLLPRRGTLWTFTTQEFLPKEPYAGGETMETFRPYGVGLVQLGDEVRVEGRLTEGDPAKLRIGMEVRAGGRPVPDRSRRHRGHDVRLRSRSDGGGADVDDVAIIGVGLHPFGRFGPKSAIDMGADAIRAALADAGVAVEGRAVRVRRQLRGRQPRRGHRPARAHRHPVHGRLQRLRHRGDGAAAHRRRHPLGPVRHRRGRRHGQARAGRVHVRPRRLRRARPGTARSATSSRRSSSP